MSGWSKLLQSVDVDGVPAFFVETGQTLRATLMFRAGMVDETLPARGWTHLSEHLAMRECARPPATSNASVSALFTEFTVTGEPEEVVEFFALLCQWFREPLLYHLGHERKILNAESARDSYGEFANHVSHRFGAQGYGLLACPELGLHQVREDQLRSLVARSFVSGNAVLALNGHPPPGLRLDLPSGPRTPIPTSAHLGPPPPYHCHSWGWLAASSGLCRGAMESTVAVDLLTHAITTKLRDELGQSYATTGVVERIDATTVMVMTASDVSDDGELQVVDSVHRVYERLARVGPSAQDVETVRVQRLRALRDDLTGEWQTLTAARAHLRDEPPVLVQELRSFIESMSPDSLTPTMTELASSLIVTSPAGLESATELPFADKMANHPAPENGLVFYAARAPLDPTELTVSDDVIQVADWSGNLRRTSMRDCAALVKYEDGGRIIWSAHGDAFLLEPTLWRDGEQAVSAVDRTIDPSVHVRLPARPRDALPQAPRITLLQRLAAAQARPAGSVVLYASLFVFLGGLGTLIFGASNMPGGGPWGLVFIALMYAAVMTAIYGKQPKNRSRTRHRSTAPRTTNEPPPETQGTINTTLDTTITCAAGKTRDSMLISRSCTTGWLDWIHGELWLTPDAIVRRRLGLAQTLRNGSGPTLTLPERNDPGSLHLSRTAVLAGHRTNRYIELDDIVAASLKCGTMNGCLTITTRAGQHHKFLWLASDPALAVLKSSLSLRTPGHVTIE